MANNITRENLASEKNYDPHAEEKDHEETLWLSSNLCCCLQGLQPNGPLRGGGDVWRKHLLQQQQQEQAQGDQFVVVEDESWLVKSAKKVKEVSKVLAGPKWKNFLRGLSKWEMITNKKKRLRSQYDPQSYALNFNDGINRVSS